MWTFVAHTSADRSSHVADRSGGAIALLLMLMMECYEGSCHLRRGIVLGDVDHGRVNLAVSQRALDFSPILTVAQFTTTMTAIHTSQLQCVCWVSDDHVTLYVLSYFTASDLSGVTTTCTRMSTTPTPSTTGIPATVPRRGKKNK